MVRVASVEVSEWRPPGAGCSLASAASAVRSCRHHNIAGDTPTHCHTVLVTLSYCHTVIFSDSVMMTCS